MCSSQVVATSIRIATAFLDNSDTFVSLFRESGGLADLINRAEVLALLLSTGKHAV